MTSKRLRFRLQNTGNFQNVKVMYCPLFSLFGFHDFDREESTHALEDNIIAGLIYSEIDLDQVAIIIS
jgi:hypothetical protein